LGKNNLLISSAGRRVELVKIFQESVADLSLPIEVFACDCDPEWSPVCQLVEKAFKVSSCLSPNFIDQIIEYCDQFNIGFIVPTIDTELEVYAQNLSLLKRHNIQVAISALEAITLMREKYQTSQFFLANDISSPVTQSFSSTSTFYGKKMIAKPVDGSLSEGIYTIDDDQSLEEVKPRILSSGRRYVFQEYVTGTEYTVNCFISEKGELISAVPHRRVKVRAGEVCFAVTEQVPALAEVAKKIAKHLSGAKGHICFQSIMDEKGDAYTIEMNGRFGGGSPLADKAGCKSAKWLLEEWFGVEEKTYSSSWKPNLKMLRYDSAIFSG